MIEFFDDIYTEPSGVDVSTLANLGPMAGVWEGARGLDIKPKKDGPRQQACVEEDTVMLIRGKEDEPFHHIDRNLLHKVGEPTPHPLARR